MTRNTIEEYEYLVFKRAKLQKEARKYYYGYIHLYGEYLNEIFDLQIKTLKLKSKITYCSDKQDNNIAILRSELNESINNSIKNYEEELKNKREEKEYIDSTLLSPASLSEVNRIENMYVDIIHKILPETHPSLEDDPDIFGLFEKATIAFETNNLKDMEKTYKTVDSITGIDASLCLDDLPTKLADVKKDIMDLVQTIPYTLKQDISSVEVILNKQRTFENDIMKYDNYIKLLEKECSEFSVREDI